MNSTQIESYSKEMPVEDQEAEASIAVEVLSPTLPEAEAEIDPVDTGMTEAEDHDAAIEAAVTSATETIAFDRDDSKSLIACIRGLQEGQTQQTQLIQKLHKTVLNTRTIINELIVTQNELKDEIDKLKAPAIPSLPSTVTTCENCKATVTANPTDPSQACLPVNSTVTQPTPDEEIDAIIEARRRKSQWPVKHSTLNCFSVQQDLVKLRFHHSEKYQHIPVRIPKTDKNKDGTKPCKLCSEGKVRRKTTWMCATCEVPLCTRPLMGEEAAEGGGVLSHHARWHTARDLVAEHLLVHASLKDGRESRKRSREMSGLEDHHVHVDHHAMVDVHPDVLQQDVHHDDVKLDNHQDV